MKVLFKLEPRMETAYILVHRLRCLFKSKITPEEAKPKYSIIYFAYLCHPLKTR